MKMNSAASSAHFEVDQFGTFFKKGLKKLKFEKGEPDGGN
jgi:hypothetical protein